MRPTRRTSLSSREHSGFSLLELLIVLALLAMIAALAVPALRNPLDKSRLRSSAQLVQSALAGAKSHALREGNAVQFRYEIGGRRFRVERVTTPSSFDDQFHEAMQEFGTSAANSESSDGLLTDSQVDGRLLREDTLTNGVTFLAASALTSTESTSMSSSPETLVESDDLLPESQWSEPIVFSPNGRTQNATIVIQGNRDFVTKVELRGLTAAATYSDPFRHNPAVDETNLEADFVEQSR